MKSNRSTNSTIRSSLSSFIPTTQRFHSKVSYLCILTILNFILAAWNIWYLHPNSPSPATSSSILGVPQLPVVQLHHQSSYNTANNYQNTFRLSRIESPIYDPKNLPVTTDISFWNAHKNATNSGNGVDTCNLIGVKVLLLETHLEGNLGDEMETTPLLQYLHNCGVHITVALSEWLPLDSRIHSRTSREQMYVHEISTQDYSTYKVNEYHAVIVAPGPWNLCALDQQWMGGRQQHVDKNDDESYYQTRPIDVFFGGSIFGGGANGGGSDRASQSSSLNRGGTMRSNDRCNPNKLLEQRFIPNMQLMVLRESASYQYALQYSHHDQDNTKGIMLGADLSYSYQPSIAAFMYWRDYYIAKGYGGRNIYPQNEHVEPMVLLFSRANNFARGVRIVRDGDGVSGNVNDEYDRRQRLRQRQRKRRPRGNQRGELDENNYDMDYDRENLQNGNGGEDNETPTSKLIVKLMNGTKLTLNTSHVVFASSSDVEDAQHFEFLRDEYPYVFRQLENGDGTVESGGKRLQHRDPLVLCQSVEQLFALVSIADHVYTDRYHPGIAAHMFNIKLTVLSYGSEQLKLNGLAEMTEKYTPQEFRRWNQNSFDELGRFLQRRQKDKGK